MGIEEIIAKIRSNKSVEAAFLLEGEIYQETIEEESSVSEVSMGMPLINRALEEVRKRKVAVCLFCDGTFEAPTDHVLVMEDTLGNVVGHDVPARIMSEYKDDPNIIWLCDDFALFPGRAKTFDIVMVMLPHNVSSIGENDGAKDPILLYPATTTDTLLRRYFKIPLDSRIASAILAFDVF